MTKKDSGKQLLEVLDGLEQSIPVMEVREGKRGYRRGNNLSHREFQVAEYVSKGYSNRTISEVSGLQEQSVKNLVSVVMRKLNCENRTQVALRLLANDVGPIVD
jgi:DNA-binding NarL/FixJ family response regulator